MTFQGMFSYRDLIMMPDKQREHFLELAEERNEQIKEEMAKARRGQQS